VERIYSGWTFGGNLHYIAFDGNPAAGIGKNQMASENIDGDE
jgi:hypothetical protein